MKLTVIDTGSAGNCYVLDCGGRKLLLDAGVSVKRILAALDYSLSAVSGVLLTHEHMDHAKAVADLMGRGISVYATRGTGEALGITKHHRFKPVDFSALFRPAGFVVGAFKAVHDAADPAGYLIGAGGERVAYVTDTAYLTVGFRALTYLIVECNHVREGVTDEGSSLPESVRRRIAETHMNLDVLAAYVGQMDQSRLQGILLVHGSRDRGDMCAAVVSLVRAAPGVRVRVAEPGLVVKTGLRVEHTVTA